MNLADFKELFFLSAKIRLKKLFKNKFLSLTQKIIKYKLFIRIKNLNLRVKSS